MTFRRSRAAFGAVLTLHAPARCARRGLVWSGVALALALVLDPPSAAARTLTDDLGREVRLADPVRRIVSLAPNLTEIVYALGLGQRLVGVTDFCDFPPEAARVARVGGVTAPSAERVLALEPDLVLATTAGNGRDETLALARLGLPVVVTDPRDLEGVARSFVLIGEAAGVPEAGARLAARFRARLAAVRAAVAGRPRPRTLLLVWPDPLVAAGPKTFLSRLLEAAGATNVLSSDAASRLTAQYPILGVESLLALAPEAIVLAAHQGATLDALARLRRYDEVPAVRDGRLGAVDQAILVRPGPRLADAAEALARVLHGAQPRSVRDPAYGAQPRSVSDAASEAPPLWGGVHGR